MIVNLFTLVKKVVFETKSWCPPESSLQDIAKMVVEDGYACEGPTAWLSNYNTALEELRHVDDTCDGKESWSRPSADTDKLYMSLGGGLNMFFIYINKK